MMLLSLLLGCGDAPAEGAGGGVTAERHAPDANATRVEVARIRGDATPAMRLSLPGEIEGSQVTAGGDPLYAVVLNVGNSNGSAKARMPSRAWISDGA